jgi:iron(III) transport system ATP-binding protein
VTATDTAIRLSGLRKAFGQQVAIEAVELDLRAGETLAVLGPSGCGKTTLLRMIAGLERPDAGEVVIGGRLVDGSGVHVPPEQRRVGMVFQDVALFPHLSVAENVGFGLARQPAASRAARVAELLALVGLGEAAGSRPHELSGGMQQRVALARALAPGPDVILLDEPFAGLDMPLRTQLRVDVREVLRASGATALLVTHDQADALTIADRVAVMRRGVIDQVGTPESIYAEPATPFVASFVGIANLVPARIEGGSAHTYLGTLRVRSDVASGHGVVLVRPEHFDLLAGSDPSGGVGGRGVHGTVVSRRFAGSELLYEVATGVEPDAPSPRLWIEAGPLARQLEIGDPVVAVLRVEEAVAFAARQEPAAGSAVTAMAGRSGVEGR